MFIRSTQTSLAPKHTAVTSYLDGTAFGIEAPVMAGADKFEKSSADPGLSVSTVGRRIAPNKQKNRALMCYAAAGAAVAGAVAVGLVGDPALGCLVAATALPPALLGYKQMKAAKASPNFLAPEIKTESQAQSVLSASLEKQRKANPDARQVVYLSGHGNHKEVAGFSHRGLGQVLRGNPVDLTVLDACLCSQLEVVSELAPFAGLVISSADIVPTEGLPIEEMFDGKRTPESMFEDCIDATLSASLIDTRAVKKELLPALDRLGSELCKALKGTGRSTVMSALKSSESPEHLSERIDLESFLTQLKEREFSPENLDEARSAFETSIKRNHRTPLTFRLDAKGNESLPRGWRDFLSTLDKHVKISSLAIV